MSHLNIWNELGISPTKNVREIKKAYAAKSKLVHPEEHPEEFQKLHDAYKAALDIANSNVSFSPPAVKAESTEQKMPEPVRATIEEEDHSLDFSKISKENKTDEETEPEQNFDFNDAIQRNSLRHDNEIMEKTEVVIKNANALYNHKINGKELDWLKIFDNNIIDEIKYEPIFLEELYRFLESHKINEGLANAIYILYEISDAEIDYHDLGRFEDIFQLIIKERTRIYDNLLNSIKLCSASILLLMLVMLCMWAAELWFWSIPVVLPILFLILKLEKLQKRKKNFNERYF